MSVLVGCCCHRWGSDERERYRKARSRRSRPLSPWFQSVVRERGECRTSWTARTLDVGGASPSRRCSTGSAMSAATSPAAPPSTPTTAATSPGPRSAAPSPRRWPSARRGDEARAPPRCAKLTFGAPALAPPLRSVRNRRFRTWFGTGRGAPRVCCQASARSKGSGIGAVVCSPDAVSERRRLRGFEHPNPIRQNLSLNGAKCHPSCRIGVLPSSRSHRAPAVMKGRALRAELACSCMP